MSTKTEEVIFVPVDELEKELDSVVQKLKHELRKAHSRNTDLAKKLQSKEERNAIIEERNTDLAKKLQSKEERNAIIEERLIVMSTEMRRTDDVLKRTQNEIMMFEEVVSKLQKALEMSQNELKRMHKSNSCLQMENVQLLEALTMLKNEKETAVEKENSFKLRLVTKETELQGKDDAIEKKNSEMKALNKHISNSKIYIEKLQSRIDDTTEQKVKDDFLHKETVESLQSRIEQMEAQKTKENIEHTDIVKKLQAHVDEERKNFYDLSYQYSQLIQGKQAAENERKPGDPEHRIQNLLLLRQAKEQQTELSHHITELSDEKRPTKLVEEFSELYDNEWTDAFKYTLSESEEQNVDFKLKLLMRANELCRNACSEHTNAIKQSFSTLVVETDHPTREVCGEVPGKLVSESKRTRQATDDGLGRTNAAIQKRKIEMDFEQTFRNDAKETIIEIGKFFKQQLSEDVEKVGTEIILEEQNINQHQKSVVAYIQKCMNICWSMWRHVPPVHLDFPEVSKDIPFDINRYKPYTKSGTFVQYTVWPAVYLHEGGPMLCKGIAQGRK